ncbi:MAG: hypothetical protein JNJ46_24365 [Myxococcales bacterium]|nr:hypothetical protein [Myxococcales bacterium]
MSDFACIAPAAPSCFDHAGTSARPRESGPTDGPMSEEISSLWNPNAAPARGPAPACSAARPVTTSEARALFGHYAGSCSVRSAAAEAARPATANAIANAAAGPAPSPAPTRRAQHHIVANPHVAVAVPGSKIRYALSGPASESDERVQHQYQWSCLNDLTHAPDGAPDAQMGPDDSPIWEATWGFSGQHTIRCHVQHRKRTEELFSCFAETSEIVEFRQTVRSEHDVLLRSMATQDPQTAPEKLLAGVRGYRETLLDAEKQPHSARIDPRLKRQLGQYVEAMEDRLAPTEGCTRYPIQAAHIEKESAQVCHLRAFVARTARDESQQTWVLVDVTNPVDRRLSGEYQGTGADAGQAIRAAVKAWNKGNRYPRGSLRLCIPKETGVELSDEFETDGSSFWDSISDFFSWVAGGAAIAAAVVATIVPEPVVSKAAAALLWTSIIGGAVGSSISLAQRRSERTQFGSGDLLDLAGIAGNLLGARWAVGATVRGLSLAGSRMGSAVIYGRIGVDSAQGILLGFEYGKEYAQIENEPDPKRRTDQVLALLARATMSGGLLVLSVRGNFKDLNAHEAASQGLLQLGNAAHSVDLALTAAHAAPPPAMSNSVAATAGDAAAAAP